MMWLPPGQQEHLRGFTSSMLFVITFVNKSSIFGSFSCLFAKTLTLKGEEATAGSGVSVGVGWLEVA
jgi:hypothetical protein